MFGYVMIDRSELKGKDFDRYQAFYCGICQDLKKKTGQASRMTLTYDMTFLAILLTGLYEGTTSEERHFCALHPGRKRWCLRNRYTGYAADMSVLLTYHNLMDDWIDDKNPVRLGEAGLVRRACRRIASEYPRQERAVQNYLRDLHRAERENSRDIDLASGLTGTLMREIFLFKRDIWEEDLGKIGFYLGKFIYLMDAYDDLEKDRKKGNYNPFRELSEEADYQKKASDILMMQAAGASRAFERLPIVENIDILRNILYSGIWIKFRQKNHDLEEAQKKQNRQ